MFDIIPARWSDGFNNRQKIEYAEWVLRNSGLNDDSLTIVKESDIDDYYSRELFIKAGTTAIGKIHLFSHIFMILYGDIDIATDDFIERITCDIDHPVVKIIPSNSKKMVYAHADSSVVTFHKKTDCDLVVDSDLSWIDTIMLSEVVV